MTDTTEKIALALEPQSETLASIPLMKAMVSHHVSESLVEAKKLVLDLRDISPQVVWVPIDEREAFEDKLIDILIETRVVSKVEADRISIENKPVRGNIDLHIRSRGDLSDDMIQNLKDQQLISGFRKGKDASGIYHWKDDRWYQDWYLVIFSYADIPKIESVINENGYIIMKS